MPDPQAEFRRLCVNRGRLRQIAVEIGHFQQNHVRNGGAQQSARRHSPFMPSSTMAPIANSFDSLGQPSQQTGHIGIGNEQNGI